jgi:aminopeptidase N
MDDHGDGRVRCTFARSGLRDFPLVLLDGTVAPRSATASGVTIRAWYTPRHEEASAITLDRGVVSVDTYTALFGPLPFPCVDIVEAPLQRVAGVECSGLFLVAADYAASPRDPFFDVIVSHEMAHQWFYAAVGNDPTEAPWLDESLATFASNVFLSLAVSDGAARSERAQWATAYQHALLSAPDLRVTSPLYAFRDSGTYSAFAYSGGAHELDALRKALGDDAFFRGLAAYYQNNLGRIAVGFDLERSFRDACGCWPTSPLFDSALTPSL